MVAGAALPPVDVSILALVGLSLSLWLAARAATARAAVAAGVVFGVGFFGTALAWSSTFGVGVLAVLATSQAVFWAPVTWASWRGRARSVGWRIATPAMIVPLVEAARARVPLGGLEWGQLGVAAHGLPVRDAAAVVGTLGVGALVTASAAAVGVVLERPPARRVWRPLSAVALTVVALIAAGGRHWTQPAGALAVAIVQVAPTCPGRPAVDCPDRDADLRTRFLTATDQLRTRVDLVLWGESALTGLDPSVVGRDLVADGGILPAPVFAGVTSPTPAGTFLNRNVLFGTDGRVLGDYAKRHPVPFGEYVPGRDLVGGLADVGRLVPRDMRRGREAGEVVLGTGVALGTVSSWEVTFSRLVREAALGSDAVVTLTTQATYGRRAVSDQLLRAVQLRAAEHQKAMLVAATTGRSAVVPADGVRGATTRLYGPDVLEVRVELRRGATPYARLGDAPIVGTAAIGGLVLLWRIRKRPGPATRCRRRNLRRSNLGTLLT